MLLGADAPAMLTQKARALDLHFNAARYPDAHFAGAPFENYGPTESEQAIHYAEEIIRFAPIIEWPGRAEVIDAVRVWFERERATHPDLLRAGYFGSLTDGIRYGFGSDADVVFVVSRSNVGEIVWL